MTDKLIPTKRTEFTEVELVHTIVQAYRNMFGRTPYIQECAILWAHFCLECGKGKACYNWNVGNVKYSKGHDYCMYKCSEIIDGKEQFFSPPHFQTWFRSYNSLLDSVSEHLKFLSKDRYKLSLEAAQNWNVDQYVEELKKGGYFTAGLERYKKGVNSLYQEFMNKYTNEVYDDPYEDS